MKHLLFLLLLTITCQTVKAQSENQPKHEIHFGFQGSMMLIPIDSLQTAYYVINNKRTIDLHIIPNDSLDQLISDWQEGKLLPADYNSNFTRGNHIYLKSYPNATEHDIKEVTATILLHGVKSVQFLKLEKEEQKLLEQLL